MTPVRGLLDLTAGDAAYNIYLRQLQGVLNAAARLIACRRKSDSISSTIRDVLHWLPIRQRVHFKLSVLMFNWLRNLAPSYLVNMCQPVTSNLHRRRLRSAVRGDLRRRQFVTVHAALLSLGRQRGMRYLHHYATTNSLRCHFVVS